MSWAAPHMSWADPHMSWADPHVSLADPENSIRGILTFFLVINIFHRGPYEPPFRSNWTQGVQLLLNGGLYQNFLGNL